MKQDKHNILFGGKGDGGEKKYGGGGCIVYTVLW